MVARVLRVAVASTDGSRVDQHLGRAEQFYIFETSADGSTLLGQRRLEPGAARGGHDPARMAGLLAQVEDCTAVVALEAGPAFRDLLESRGIRVLTSDWTIEAVLHRIAHSYLVRNNRPRELQP
jgi:predicted Fe-Mo cluster-binding NifX family protein